MAARLESSAASSAPSFRGSLITSTAVEALQVLFIAKNWSELPCASVLATDSEYTELATKHALVRAQVKRQFASWRESSSSQLI